MTTSSRILTAVVVLVCAVGVSAYLYKEGHKKEHKVTLTWDAAPNATSYNVYRRDEGGSFQKIGSSKNTLYLDTPVPGGVVLYYGVSTVQGDNEGPISKEITVKVPGD